MKTCLVCGCMISPHPYHKDEKGVCADCHNSTLDIITGGDSSYHVAPDPVNDGNRPKLKGKHMIIKKTESERLIEQRKKMLGGRFY